MTRDGRRERRKYSAEDAAEIVRAAGYEPREVYPGLANASWRVTCLKCDQPRRIALAKVVMGILCKHRRSKTAPGDLPLQELIKKYNGGMGFRPLAREYGVACETVRAALRGHVVIRKPGWRHESA